MVGWSASNVPNRCYRLLGSTAARGADRHELLGDARVRLIQFGRGPDSAQRHCGRSRHGEQAGAT
jgi:hypothetical protein